MSVTVDLNGVLELESFLAAVPDVTRRAASQAINSVIGGSGLAEYRKGIDEQVNFPAGYLNDDRLGVTQRATPTRLEGRITGRQRATSLARFATTGALGERGGVTVRVKRSGGGKRMKNAFLVRLRRGGEISDGAFNLGLAIRLKPGQAVTGKKDTSNMVRLDANVYLLYGPSVDQVLKNDVAETKTPVVVDKIATEFFRNFQRLAP